MEATERFVMWLTVIGVIVVVNVLIWHVSKLGLREMLRREKFEESRKTSGFSDFISTPRGPSSPFYEQFKKEQEEP